MGTSNAAATSGSSPIMTNSVVPMPKAPIASASKAIGMGMPQDPRSVLVAGFSGDFRWNRVDEKVGRPARTAHRSGRKLPLSPDRQRLRDRLGDVAAAQRLA